MRVNPRRNVLAVISTHSCSLFLPDKSPKKTRSCNVESCQASADLCMTNLPLVVFFRADTKRRAIRNDHLEKGSTKVYSVLVRGLVDSFIP